MDKLKTIGITAIIVVGIMIIGYTLIPKDNSTGGYASSSAFAVATSGRIAIGAGFDAQVVSKSGRRSAIDITNDCSEDIYLVFSSTPADYGLRLNANGGSYFEENNDGMYMGEIRATSSSACNIDVVEMSY